MNLSSHLDEPATGEIPHLHAAKVIFLPEACCLYVHAAKGPALWNWPNQPGTYGSERIAAALRKEGVQDQGAGCRGSDA